MLLPVVALASMVASVAAHATFQAMWVNGVDQGSYCVRMPQSNSPVTSVSGADIACNVNPRSSANLCNTKPGDKVTVEMHQQPGDRSCAQEAIGGNHYGPVIVYMSRVTDAKTASGSSVSWFKVAEMGLVSNNPNYWGVQVLNDNCGHFTFTVPNIPPGQYLLRAEVIALHVANSVGGAQFYVSCYQLNVGGNGSGNPSPTIRLPGAYSPTDPGILVTLWTSPKSYVIPGGQPYATSSPTIATTPYPKTATWNTASQPKTIPAQPVGSSIGTV